MLNDTESKILGEGLASALLRIGRIIVVMGGTRGGGGGEAARIRRLIDELLRTLMDLEKVAGRTTRDGNDDGTPDPTP